MIRSFWVQVAHAAGSFPPIYAAFNNGLVYKFAPGRVMTYHELTDPAIIPLITRQLYRLHNVDVDSLKLYDIKGNPASYDKSMTYLDRIGDMLSNLPVRANDDGVDQAYQQLLREYTVDEMKKELAFVKDICNAVNLPVSFNHNDITGKNMVYDRDSHSITLIDYELSQFHFQYNDLAKFFLIKPLFDLQEALRSHQDEPDFTEETRTMYLQGYLNAKYENIRPEKNTYTETEFQFFDLGHRITEIIVYLEYTVMALYFINIDIGVDFVSSHKYMKGLYIQHKNELPSLRDEYLKLKNCIH